MGLKAHMAWMGMAPACFGAILLSKRTLLLGDTFRDLNCDFWESRTACESFRQSDSQGLLRARQNLPRAHPLPSERSVHSSSSRKTGETRW